MNGQPRAAVADAHGAGALPADANPLATRFIRPGRAEFLFPAGSDLQTLILRLEQHGWRGQIVGPHGTGKSTLLSALRPGLEAAGREFASAQLQEGQRTLPFSRAAGKAWHPRTLVVIDGYEQLSAWSRWRLWTWVRRAGCGLLVTSHRNTGLPELWRSTVSPELACAVVARLQVGHPRLLRPDDVQRSLAAQKGNFREALFALYDVYETRRRKGKR